MEEVKNGTCEVNGEVDGEVDDAYELAPDEHDDMSAKEKERKLPGAMEEDKSAIAQILEQKRSTQKDLHEQQVYDEYTAVISSFFKWLEEEEPGVVLKKRKFSFSSEKDGFLPETAEYLKELGFNVNERYVDYVTEF